MSTGGAGRAAPGPQNQLFRPEREEERPLERLDEPLELERAPEEREDDPLERLTPDERDEEPVDRRTPEDLDPLDEPEERPTPDELEPPVRERTAGVRERVVLLRPTPDPVRLVVLEGTARLPVVPVLERVVAREPERLFPARFTTAERLVREVPRVAVAVSVPLLLRPTVDRVVPEERVLPTVERMDRSPAMSPREGRVPVAEPLAAVVLVRPVATMVRVSKSPRPVRDPRPPVIPVSRPPRVPRVRLVSALRAIVAPLGA